MRNSRTFVAAMVAALAMLVAGGSAGAEPRFHAASSSKMTGYTDTNSRVIETRVVVEHDLPGSTVSGKVIVSPTLLQVPDAARDSTVTAGEIVVRNRFDHRATFQLVVQGVLPSRTTVRRVRFVDAADPRAAKTAASWVQLPAKQVTLDSLQRATFQVAVVVPKDTSPGGHYAAVAVRTTSAVGGGKGTSVGVQSDIEVPILITVRGPARTRIKLEDVHAPGLIHSKDHWRLDALVDNTGDVHATPTGSVEVRNLFGKVVATLPATARIVLPGGRVPTHVTWKGTPWLGYYRATLRMRAAKGQPVVKSHALTLWVLPPWWVLAVIAGALVLTWWWRRWRRRRAWDDDAGDGVDTWA